jgi:hypothetical protein
VIHYTGALVDCDTHGQQAVAKFVGGDNRIHDGCVRCRRDELAADRRCGCDCGTSIVTHAANVKYVSDRHKQRAHRHDLKARERALGVRLSLSVQTLDSVNSTENRRGDGDNGASKPKRAASKPRKPQLRVSYRKAVDAVSELVQDFQVHGHRMTDGTVEAARELAETRMRDLLTDAQKAAL